MKLIFESTKKNVLRFSLNDWRGDHSFYITDRRSICNIPRNGSNSLKEHFEKDINVHRLCLVRNVKDRLLSAFRLMPDTSILADYLFDNKKITNNSLGNLLVHFIPQTFFIKNFPYQPILEFRMLNECILPFTKINTHQDSFQKIYLENEDIFDRWYYRYEKQISDEYKEDFSLCENMLITIDNGLKI